MRYHHRRKIGDADRAVPWVSVPVRDELQSVAFLLSDTRRIGRYRICSGAYDSICVETDGQTVSGEDPDSLHYVTAQCRWLEKVRTETGDNTCGATCGEKVAKPWKFIQKVDKVYLREWFGLVYLLWRVREKICCPSIPEMTTNLGERFF